MEVNKKIVVGIFGMLALGIVLVSAGNFYIKDEKNDSDFKGLLRKLNLGGEIPAQGVMTIDFGEQTYGVPLQEGQRIEFDTNEGFTIDKIVHNLKEGVIEVAGKEDVSSLFDFNKLSRSILYARVGQDADKQDEQNPLKYIDGARWEIGGTEDNPRRGATIYPKFSTYVWNDENFSKNTKTTLTYDEVHEMEKELKDVLYLKEE